MRLFNDYEYLYIQHLVFQYTQMKYIINKKKRKKISFSRKKRQSELIRLMRGKTEYLFLLYVSTYTNILNKKYFF